MQIPLWKIGKEECLKQREIRKCKSRCGKPSKQRDFDSGKKENANPAVENRADRRFMTAGNQKNANSAVMKWDFADAGIGNLESVQSSV